jgi:hypothetical protein
MLKKSTVLQADCCHHQNAVLSPRAPAPALPLYRALATAQAIAPRPEAEALVVRYSNPDLPGDTRKFQRFAWLTDSSSAPTAKDSIADSSHSTPSRAKLWAMLLSNPLGLVVSCVHEDQTIGN